MWGFRWGFVEGVWVIWRVRLIIFGLGGDFDGIFSGVSILLGLEKGVKK